MVLSQIENRYIKLKERAKYFENLRVFLESIFKPVWERAIHWTKSHWPNENVIKTLPQREQTLSPSDFGFHNALERTDGSLCFIDLEYFGFDDPVKLITDFIWHPAMSLSPNQKKFWVKESINIFGKTEKLQYRVVAAWPIIGLRWSLIVLNEFLKEGWEKRVHAKKDIIKFRDERLKKQLTKSQLICEFVMKHKMECPYIQF
jgi:hypothetical protein